MRAAIVGLGPAGATLARLLSMEGAEVTVYEGSPRPGCRCAWGTYLSRFTSFFGRLIGRRRASSLVKVKVERVFVNGAELEALDLCVVDKPGLVWALAEGSTVVRAHVPFEALAAASNKEGIERPPACATACEAQCQGIQ